MTDRVVKAFVLRSGVGECLFDPSIALAGEARVVVIPGDAVGVAFVDQSWDLLGRVATSHEEIASVLAVGFPESREGVKQKSHAGRGGVV